MNQVATKPQPQTAVKPVTEQPKKPSLIEMMAAQYSMDPVQFSNSVKKTAMPGNVTNEEFAAFMMVAHEYKLNPFLRELYAFPKKGGGIVPMVSVDGWINIINSHPLMAGFELESHFDDANKLAAVTCRIHRKDRPLPIVITEYMIECFRNTEPWRMMPNRMLRHKAMIQAARYAFGLSGIYDEDEAKDISQIKDVTPTPRPQQKDFIIPAKTTYQGEQEAKDPQQDSAEIVDTETGELTEYGVPDAYEAGQKAKAAGVSLDNMPANVKQFPELSDAYTQGYSAEEE